MGEKTSLSLTEWRTRLTTDLHFIGLMDATQVRLRIEETNYTAPKLKNTNAFMNAARS
jgi:hypothetical protein